MRGRRDLADLAGPGRKPFFPGGDQRGESRLARGPLGGSGALRAGQHAERMLRREQFVVRHAGMVVHVAHCSRQALSLIIARRIQLFMVPSGTFVRSASSS